MTLKYRGKIEGDKIIMEIKAKDAVKQVLPDSTSTALQKVGRGGMYENTGRRGIYDIGVGIDRTDYTQAFTLTRVQ